MATSTKVHAEVKAALEAAGLHVQWGPADSLPTVDGLPGQAVVLWPAAPIHDHGRMCGGRSGRTDLVAVTCVGATSLDALAVADKVEAAIGGVRLPSGGLLRQAAASRPVAEPNTDPRRVSLGVEYSTITKG